MTWISQGVSATRSSWSTGIVRAGSTIAGASIAEVMPWAIAASRERGAGTLASS